MTFIVNIPLKNPETPIIIFTTVKYSKVHPTLDHDLEP